MRSPYEVAVWCSRWSISIKRLKRRGFRPQSCDGNRRNPNRRIELVLSCFVLSAWNGKSRHQCGIQALCLQEKSSCCLCRSPGKHNPVFRAIIEPTLCHTNHTGMACVDFVDGGNFEETCSSRKALVAPGSRKHEISIFSCKHPNESGIPNHLRPQGRPPPWDWATSWRPRCHRRSSWRWSVRCLERNSKCTYIYIYIFFFVSCFCSGRGGLHWMRFYYHYHTVFDFYCDWTIIL